MRVQGWKLCEPPTLGLHVVGGHSPLPAPRLEWVPQPQGRTLRPGPRPDAEPGTLHTDMSLRVTKVMAHGESSLWQE